MKKIANYICLGLLAIYASLPFIPLYHYRAKGMAYDPLLGQYVDKTFEAFYNSFDNFPGVFENSFLAVIAYIIIYSLIGLTAFFFIKDFSNGKKRKWFLFVSSSVLIVVFLFMFNTARGSF